MPPTLRRSLAHAGYILLLTWRDPFRLLDLTLWPLVLLLSMLLFADSLRVDPAVTGRVVLGALGWRVLFHFQLEAVTLHMDHQWYGMSEHLMTSPLRWWESILGGAVSAGAKVLVIAALFLGVGHFGFHFTVREGGASLRGLLACAACGSVLAVFSLGIAFLKRGDAYALIFAFPDAIAVLSGVFYPLEVLPAPLRQLARLLPTSHAFNLLKATLGQGAPEPAWFLGTLGAWALAAVLFILWAERRARRLGRLMKVK